MTFLLNSEIGPAFMQDGRVTHDDREGGDPDGDGVFYQLAGRRINWDLTDYHPLLAQRARRRDTFTDDAAAIGRLPAGDRDPRGAGPQLPLILSDVGAKGGGGALATFNRSIGPFQADRGEVTFLRSVKIIDPAATGKAGTAGVYRSPFSLPNGEILASYDGAVTDPAAATPHYALVAVNDQTGARRMLAGDGSLSYVEARAGLQARPSSCCSGTCRSWCSAVTPTTRGDTAIMHFPDAPVLATLLGANLRQQPQRRGHGPGRRAEDLRGEPAGRSQMAPGTFTGTRTSLGQASFESDHSLKVFVPARKPLILEFVDGSGSPVFTMTEEHQVAANEYITPGPPRALFNNICGGCHGSLSGSELDVAVSADALTGASVSMSRNLQPKNPQ